MLTSPIYIRVKMLQSNDKTKNKTTLGNNRLKQTIVYYVKSDAIVKI